MGDAMNFVDPGGAALGLYDGPPDYAGKAKKQEKERQALITKGMGDINSAFAGYTPDFYQQRAAAYQQYALPQLSHQYQQTKNAMLFGQANRGLLGSSVSTKQNSDLSREMGLQKQAIADVGRGQAQDLQRQVEAQRTALQSQLYETANPTLAGQNATAAAASMAVPSVYAPLGNMFSNLLNQYYARQLLSTYQPRSYVQAPGGGYTNQGALPEVTWKGGN